MFLKVPTRPENNKFCVTANHTHSNVLEIKNDMQLPQNVMGCLAPGLNVGRVVQYEGLVHESGAKCSAVI